MTPCKPWTGAIDADGYGTVGRHGRAHRAAFERHAGPVPAGHVVHHRCGVRACVEPSHLEALTRADHNSRHYADGLAARLDAVGRSLRD